MANSSIATAVKMLKPKPQGERKIDIEYSTLWNVRRRLYIKINSDACFLEKNTQKVWHLDYK